MSEFTIQSVWHMDIDENRFHEIAYLQEQVSRRRVPLDRAGFNRMRDHCCRPIFLALCWDEEIVGMAQATLIHNLIDSKAFVDSVAVHPDLRGQGHGHRLMDALRREIQRQWPSVTKIFLTSSEKRGTRGFYMGLGYVPREGEAATLLYELRL